MHLFEVKKSQESFRTVPIYEMINYYSDCLLLTFPLIACTKSYLVFLHYIAIPKMCLLFFCLFVVMFNDAARFLEYTASNNCDDREY